MVKGTGFLKQGQTNVLKSQVNISSQPTTNIKKNTERRCRIDQNGEYGLIETYHRTPLIVTMMILRNVVKSEVERHTLIKAKKKIHSVQPDVFCHEGKSKRKKNLRPCRKL